MARFALDATVARAFRHRPPHQSPDLNVLINHHHPAAARISIVAVEPFVFDPRLF